MKYTKEDLAFLKSRRKEQHRSTEGMAGKLCVISGATSGVGLEAARRLAKGGADLVLVCRNKAKGEAVKAELLKSHGTKADLVIADFSRLDDVRHAGEAIRQRYGKVDVLINSAGIHSTRRFVTADGNELVFQVNHIAPFLLTMLLLDLLKKGGQGRVIQVNSEGHRFGGLNMDDLDWKKRRYIGLRAYGASKTAQIMTVMKLAEQLKGTGVTINAMHPGGVKTGIGSNNGLLYRAWLRGVVWHFLKDPAISGEALNYLAAAPELYGTSGRYFYLTIDEKPLLHALDETIIAAIWEKSLQLAGL
ncbi:MAG: SDR family NAD(P)-dependent oxidoreductase, partial [Eubacteriales bacterium]|nr:SDR family NAD(P)-dependent oxidoreductase [Eubacteriales bacterium]